jgi:glycerophosphoryl diester phosphodiesterase
MVQDTSQPAQPPEEDDSPGVETDKPKKEPVAKAGEDLGVLRTELTGIQGLREGDDASREALSKEIEALREAPVERFWTGLLGEGFITTFLSKITSPFLGGFLGKEIPMEEFEKKLALAEKDAEGQPVNIEDFVISHRALGYGKAQANSIEAATSAINGGEKQIEIDLRLGDDGEIYVEHDPIKGIKNPGKKFPKLTDMMALFANHERQDVAIYFDIKEVGVLDKLDAAIASVDGQNQERPGYEPIAKRHFVSSFNDEVLAKAKEQNPERPLIFNYIPTARLKGADKLVANMGHKKIGKICKTIDKTYGTSLVQDLGTTIVKVDGEPIKDHPENAANKLNLFAELPPPEILKNVTYIGVPLQLATKNLVANAHKAGVKVGVWGAKESDVEYAIGVLQVDMIISDNPDLKKGSTEKKPAGPEANV